MRTRRRRRTAQRKRGVGLVSGVVNKVRSILKRMPPETLKDLGMCAKIAYNAARQAVQGSGGRSGIIMPRVMTIPKRGGFLPLLPVLSALGGVGSLAGGINGLIKTIRNIRSGASIWKKGGRLCSGIKLKPLKKGYGLYLEPYAGRYPYSGRNNNGR